MTIWPSNREVLTCIFTMQPDFGKDCRSFTGLNLYLVCADFQVFTASLPLMKYVHWPSAGFSSRSSHLRGRISVVCESWE